MLEEERGGVGIDSSVRRGIMQGDGEGFLPTFNANFGKNFLKLFAGSTVTTETGNLFQDRQLNSGPSYPSMVHKE